MTHAITIATAALVAAKAYVPVVCALLAARRPSTILDAPSGSGWLPGQLTFRADVDGLDLFAQTPPAGYRRFEQHDLDQGFPQHLDRYEAIVSCEGLEHLGNPERFLASARERLMPGGLLIITTPNTWHPAARLQYLLRGFFPGFPCLVGRIERGTHMHILPWSFPQLYLFLSIAGFRDVRLHDLDEPKPRRAFEWLIAWPQWLYCRHKARRARGEEERGFWHQAGGRQSLLGRRLVVSASAPLT